MEFYEIFLTGNITNICLSIQNLIGVEKKITGSIHEHLICISGRVFPSNSLNDYQKEQDFERMSKTKKKHAS